MRIRFSADENCDLFLDGNRIASGPEAGDTNKWFYAETKADLEPGEHVLCARVYCWGKDAALAQLSVRHGFFLEAEGALSEILDTGRGRWLYKVLEGCAYTSPGVAWGAGAKLDIDGFKYPWNILGENPKRSKRILNIEHGTRNIEVKTGSGSSDSFDFSAPTACLGRSAAGGKDDVDDGWQEAETFIDERNLCPPMLPPQKRERFAGRPQIRFVSAKTGPVRVDTRDDIPSERGLWEPLFDGKPVKIPAGTRRRLIIDFDDYVCVFPEMIVSGGRGASIKTRWAEGLFNQKEYKEFPHYSSKGNRGVINKKYFHGVGDAFTTDGGAKRRCESFSWHAGRYLELTVENLNEELTIESVCFYETGFPYNFKGAENNFPSKWRTLFKRSLRTLEMCSHETFMDCPYYERQMYVGDSRISALLLYVLGQDDSLARKALELFDLSRNGEPITRSCYPIRIKQVIPSFSLFWIGMTHDYAMWRGDAAFIKAREEGIRTVLAYFKSFVNADGLLANPPGWKFMDWTKEWDDRSDHTEKWACPPVAADKAGAALNWLYVRALRQASELFAEKEYSADADKISAAARDRFWDGGRGLFADDTERKFFSAHAQCMAALSGSLSAAERKALLTAAMKDKTLAQPSLYFCHYLFEAAFRAGLPAIFFKGMRKWDFIEKVDLRTVPENPEPTRSDCHVWSGHPVYHYYANVLGVRPADFGFESVIIEPQIGDMPEAAGIIAHKRGGIKVSHRSRGGVLSSEITLPDGLSGVFVSGGRETPLRPGKQTVRG